MRQLLFYTTAGCHLCEEAEQLLQQLSKLQALEVETIDISGSQSLVDDYGLRIPVVKNRRSGAEIGWPFTLDDLVSLA